MSASTMWRAALTLPLWLFLGLPSQAGNATAEADRCSRWLDAFSQGQINTAASITVEQLKAAEVPDVYYKAQIEKIKKLYDKVTLLGGGSPIGVSMLADSEVKETGDIVRRQSWNFKNGTSNVGCVDYPGLDTPYHFLVLFDDNPDELLITLSNAARTRQAGPD